MKNTFTLAAAAMMALSASATELPISVEPASGSTVDSVTEITLTSTDDVHTNVWVGNFLLTVEKDGEKITDHTLSVKGEDVGTSVILTVSPAITEPGTYTLTLSRFSYFLEDVTGDKVLTPDSDMVLTYIVNDPLAVKAIDAIETGTPVYYSLQGVRVDNPSAGQLLIMKQGANTSKVIF